MPKSPKPSRTVASGSGTRLHNPAKFVADIMARNVNVTLLVTNDWPEPLPVTEAEIDLVVAYLGEILAGMTD